MEITKELCQRVLDTVDAGLVCGVGSPVPGKMCVEAAVNYALGLPHGDEPPCVNKTLRALKITLNDTKVWSSDQARAQGLRRLAIVQLGTVDWTTQQTVDFVTACAKLAKEFAASAASYAASYAASAASYAASAASAGDEMLTKFCECVVQIVIGIGSPGRQFLWLTETTINMDIFAANMRAYDSLLQSWPKL